MVKGKTNLTFLLLLLGIIQLTISLPQHIHKLPLTLSKNYAYYADLYIGSNKQSVSLLVDTGSRTMAAYCSLCSKGCQIPQQFLVGNSSSYQNITCSTVNDIINQTSLPSPELKNCWKKCQYLYKDYHCFGQITYGSSSIASYLHYLMVRDTITLTTSERTVFTSFGCIDQARHFSTGIWGLALSPNNQILDQIYTADKQSGLTQAKKIFSICTADGIPFMFIGGVDESIHIGQGYSISINSLYNLWWNLKQQQFGAITYNNIIVKESSISFGNFGVILDSGTDFIVFPTDMVNILSDAVTAHCQELSSICQKLSDPGIFNLGFIIIDPIVFFSGQTVDITLNGKILSTPLSNYFWNMGSNHWAFAVVSAEKYHFQMSILGSIWMNNFDIAFDRDEEKITIWDIMSCQSNRRLQENQIEYDLPAERSHTSDILESISRIKNKHHGALKNLRDRQRL